jgi:hypothetical protein
VTKQWYVGDKSIAFLRYRPTTGQVGIISIDKNYRRHGLGKYMLDIVVNDTLECGQSEKVWAVSTSDHPFWRNVWGGSFRFTGSNKPHVTCGIFSYTLKDDSPWHTEKWLTLASPLNM